MSIFKIMISYFTCFKFSAKSSKAGSFSYQFNNIQSTSSPILKFRLYLAHLFSPSQPLCYVHSKKFDGVSSLSVSMSLPYIIQVDFQIIWKSSLHKHMPVYHGVSFKLLIRKWHPIKLDLE